MLEEASGISPEIIRENGYRSIPVEGGYAELQRLGFSKVQAKNTPGLLLPLHTTDGKTPLYVYRPDTPRVDAKGRVLKYEIPKGLGVRLYCPQRCRAMLGDPSVPCFITEGQKKADALASRGLCAVAVLGVYNFKGKNNFGGITFPNDWDYIALNNRDVRIVFDSDIMTKPAVKAAMVRLTEHLQRKSAHVSAVYLPQEDGHKVGVDDYLLNHTTQDLEGLADGPRRQPQAAGPMIRILQDAPLVMSRPLSLINGRAYAATWVYAEVTYTEKQGKNGEVIVLNPPVVQQERVLIVVRDDGVMFSEKADKHLRPLFELGVQVHLPEIPRDSRLWSAGGLMRFFKGEIIEPNTTMVTKAECWYLGSGLMDGGRNHATDQ
jgi:hypothetical protein